MGESSVNPVTKIIQDEERLALPDLVEKSPLPRSKTIQVVTDTENIRTIPVFEGSLFYHEVQKL